jgi:parvulin-like peptidyl-prolyl isomerase
MKQILLILSVFIAADTLGQTLSEQLQKINTYSEAEELAKRDSTFRIGVMTLNSSVDTTYFQRQFYKKDVGDILQAEKDAYKIMDVKEDTFSRVNYIYLDGTKFSRSQIDSLRYLIIKEYRKGVLFDSLVARYNMDGNPNFGDTGWFTAEMMVKEFSEAVKKHKKSDVFLVNVPGNDWYYVVKKTYQTSFARQMVILRLQKKG